MNRRTLLAALAALPFVKGATPTEAAPQLPARDPSWPANTWPDSIIYAPEERVVFATWKIGTDWARGDDYAFDDLIALWDQTTHEIVHVRAEDLWSIPKATSVWMGRSIPVT